MPSEFFFQNPNIDPIMDDPNLEGYNVQQKYVYVCCIVFIWHGIHVLTYTCSERMT